MKAYLSYLRIVSTFAVVVLHVAAPYVLHFGNAKKNTWETAHFFDSFVRFCVPVFLMISGALLLDKDEKLTIFLQKRLKRILFPFFFWSIVYFIWIDWKTFSGKGFMQIFKDFYFGLMHGFSFHFWYIYLILGLYLFIPILRKWTISATRKDILFFLIIWLLTLFINPKTAAYFPKIEWMYFSKYLGYLVLGFYLSKLEIKSVLKMRILSLLMIISGFLFTFFLTRNSTLEQSSFDKTFYEYLSPNVMLLSVGIFLFFQTIDFKTNRISVFIDKNTFGIYLVHILILSIFKEKISDSFFIQSQILFVFYLLGISVLVFLSSLFCIALLSRISFLKKSAFIT